MPDIWQQEARARGLILKKRPLRWSLLPHQKACVELLLAAADFYQCGDYLSALGLSTYAEWVLFDEDINEWLKAFAGACSGLCHRALSTTDEGVLTSP